MFDFIRRSIRLWKYLATLILSAVVIAPLAMYICLTITMYILSPEIYRMMADQFFYDHVWSFWHFALATATTLALAMPLAELFGINTGQYSGSIDEPTAETEEDLPQSNLCNVVPIRSRQRPPQPPYNYMDEAKGSD